jgi:hypothetical protein
MSDNNLDQEIQEELMRATREMNRYGSTFVSSEQGISVNNLAIKRDIELSIRKREAKRLRIQALKQLTGGVTGLTTSLINQQSNFKPVINLVKTLTSALAKLASSFGPIGKIIGSFIEGLGVATETLMNTLDKNYSAFEKLSDSGLFGTFDELKKISLDTMLTTEVLGKVIPNQAKNLALFGGGARRGSQEFQKFASSALNLRHQFLMDGYTIEEYTESQAEYMGYVAKIGNVDQHSLKLENMRFPEYMKNIQELSNFTGISRADLRKQYADVLAENNFRAWSVRQENTVMVDNAQQIIALTETFLGSEAKIAIKDYISAGGNYAQGSPEFDKFIATLQITNSDALEQISQSLRTGDMTGVVNSYVKMGDTYDKKMGELTMSIGKDVPGMLSYANLANARAYGQELFSGTKTIDDILRQANADARVNSELDGKLATTRLSMIDTGVMVNNAFLNMNVVVPVFSKIIDGIDKISEVAYSHLGRPIPEKHKLLIEQNKKIRELTQLEIDEKRLIEERTNLIREMKEGDSSKRNNISNKNRLRKINEEISTTQRRANTVKTEVNEMRAERSFLIEQESSEQKSSDQQSDQYSVPANMQTYLAATALMESSGDPLAKARTSSASGLFQFIQSTWIETVKQMGKNYTLQDRFDPVKSAEVMNFFTQRQKSQLEKSTSREASNTDLYMAHFLGAAGASKFLNAMYRNPNLTAAQIVGIEAANANRSIFYHNGRPRSLQEVYNLFAKKMQNAEKAISSGKWGGKNLPKSVSRMLTKSSADPEGARTGGIFKGPSTGYLAMLHGDEIVIPANDSITKQNLQDTVLSSDSDNDVLLNLLTMMDKRVDTMIDIVSDTNTTQRIYARAF